MSFFRSTIRRVVQQGRLPSRAQPVNREGTGSFPVTPGVCRTPSTYRRPSPSASLRAGRPTPPARGPRADTRVCCPCGSARNCSSGRKVKKAWSYSGISPRKRSRARGVQLQQHVVQEQHRCAAGLGLVEAGLGHPQQQGAQAHLAGGGLVGELRLPCRTGSGPGGAPWWWPRSAGPPAGPLQLLLLLQRPPSSRDGTGCAPPPPARKPARKGGSGCG